MWTMICPIYVDHDLSQDNDVSDVYHELSHVDNDMSHVDHDLSAVDNNLSEMQIITCPMCRYIPNQG